MTRGIPIALYDRNFRVRFVVCFFFFCFNTSRRWGKKKG